MSIHSIKLPPKTCQNCDAKVSSYRNYCPACLRQNRKTFVAKTCADCGTEISKVSIRCQPCRYEYLKANTPKKYCKCGAEIAAQSNYCRKCFQAERLKRFEQETGRKAKINQKVPPPVPVEKAMYKWLESQDTRLANMFGRLNADQQSKTAQSIEITRRRFERQDISSGFWESVREIIEDAKKDIYFCLELEAERENLPSVELRYSSSLAAVINNG